MHQFETTGILRYVQKRLQLKPQAELIIALCNHFSEDTRWCNGDICAIVTAFLSQRDFDYVREVCPELLARLLITNDKPKRVRVCRPTLDFRQLSLTTDD